MALIEQGTPPDLKSAPAGWLDLAPLRDGPERDRPTKVLLLMPYKEGDGMY